MGEVREPQTQFKKPEQQCPGFFVKKLHENEFLTFFIQKPIFNSGNDGVK
jgi:hypothetical protein